MYKICKVNVEKTSKNHAKFLIKITQSSNIYKDAT